MLRHKNNTSLHAVSFCELHYATRLNASAIEEGSLVSRLKHKGSEKCCCKNSRIMIQNKSCTKMRKRGQKEETKFFLSLLSIWHERSVSSSAKTLTTSINSHIHSRKLGFSTCFTSTSLKPNLSLLPSFYSIPECQRQMTVQYIWISHAAFGGPGRIYENWESSDCPLTGCET